MENTERFGLLGFNGSGKTTTFRTLTNDVYFDSGDVEIFKLNTQKDFNKIRKIIGYCPQSNAIFDFLTVEETFRFYKFNSKISNNNDESLTNLLDRYGLLKFKNTLSTNLSGGNKRKLNFAIALLSWSRITPG